MGKLAKALLWVVLLAFAVFVVVTRPDVVAAAVEAVFGLFDTVGRAVGQFLR